MAKNINKHICFVLPEYSHYPGGGTKMVFLYANYLVQLGCDVTICFWPIRSLRQYHLPEPLRRMLCRYFTQAFPKWFALDERIQKRCIFEINDKTIPIADDVVATAAETAAPVAQLSPERGNKHYLVQGFELWTMPEFEVRSTFRLGMSNIVVSDWLKKLVWDESGVEPTLIKNPIDSRVFYPEPGVDRSSHQVACLFHEHENKGFKDLFKALEIVRASVPDLTVEAFGTPERPSWFPEWFTYTRSASQSQLRKLYSRSAIFACATVNEGFGLTLPESMFCGCALASTMFQGVWEYANEDCAMLSPVNDPERLAQNICRLLEDPSYAAELAVKGREYAMGQCSIPKARKALKQEFGLDDDSRA